MKTGKEIRQEFISFFEGKEHKFVRSSPVVPIDDPTLLFANAGMNQFKPFFLGQQQPEHKRVVNSQKCIRVSGKHNDLEEVGVDNYHHTFFEMLGNWSFGDYYKAEAIQWAWELFTKVWEMDEERLWASVHETDDEAAALWPQVTGLPPERVLRFGDKDNFWEMGETGPCGPCSEIHYYDGPDISKMTAEGINVEPEYKELWNLVFIQNNRLEDGSLEELPAKHVDTGAGLERIVAVIQGKGSNYATDLFTPIIEHITKITGIAYTEDNGTAHRVLADHVRMLTFSLADGALPGNEGRGYVVRRILRRAARFGRMLEQHEPFIYQLVDTVCEVMGEAFPEIIEKRRHIEKVIRAEETAFGETLDRGLEMFARAVRDLKSGDVIPGEVAFRLYDTYGFPLDLTELMAREQGLSVDTAGFDQAMEAQRERARAGGKTLVQEAGKEWVIITEGRSSEFVGYDTCESDATIRKYRVHDGGRVDLILDRTPFYAESGGQVGDAGVITGLAVTLKVIDAQRMTVSGHEEIVHQCEFDNSQTIEAVCGSIGTNQKLTATVDRERRQAIRLNHTATHLMHKALKEVLGEHVQQAGSLVAPDRLRFDLTHYEKTKDSEIAEVELIVNRTIRENRPVNASVQAYETARKGGAVAIFGEKYGDQVRVVEVPGFSMELCGGIHVDRTGDIGFFKVTSETALAAGVRRIEAVTGEEALRYTQKQVDRLQDIQNLLKASPDNLGKKVKQLIEQRRDLERQLKHASLHKSKDLVGDLAARAEDAEGVKVVARRVEEISDMNQLKDLAVDIKHHLKSSVVVLYTVANNKPQAVVVVTDDLKERIPAGTIAREIGQLLGGSGGGTPIMATAGGNDVSEIDAAVSATPDVITKVLG
ncbi:MAG: alanine--tRNA ligase [Fidelibacterota bacterium]|nr:MAG: alanine--tRNA ligase [Candidatus Neomarinimicrobiota bacterium]